MMGIVFFTLACFVPQQIIKSIVDVMREIANKIQRRRNEPIHDEHVAKQVGVDLAKWYNINWKYPMREKFRCE